MMSSSPDANESAATLQERLRSHLTAVARQRDIYLHPMVHRAVRDYVRDQLSQWGTVHPHCFEATEIRGRPGGEFQGENLVLDLPGQRPGPPILIGAHYDGVPGSPGADDNASGVAVLLELARVFAQQPAPLPIRCVAFDLEEYGLLGSRAYATDLRHQGEVIRLMLSLEMLGYCDPTPGSQHYPFGLKMWYPKRGNFIALVGNLWTIPDLRRLSRGIKHGGLSCEWLAAGLRGLIVSATRLSDHSPFWDQGYRALMVTDTAFLRNPNYHQLSDRVETLDLDFMAGVCQGLERGLRNLT